MPKWITPRISATTELVTRALSQLDTGLLEIDRDYCVDVLAHMLDRAQRAVTLTTSARCPRTNDGTAGLRSQPAPS